MRLALIFHGLILVHLGHCFLLADISSSTLRNQHLRLYDRLTSPDDSQGGGDEGISVGIDLGTTFSAVSYLDEDKIPRIVPIPSGGRTMPSVVAFHSNNNEDDATVLVGKEACQFESQTGNQAYRNVKRVIGTGGKISDVVATVVPYLKRNLGQGKTFRKNSLLHQLSDAEEYPTLLFDSQNPSQTIRPESISAHVIRRLVQAASLHTGRRVARAVMGVPAYFTDAQKEATQRAAESCGIEKVQLIPEPEAAALAYGVGKRQIFGRNQDDDDELVLVFDLGGGTYDVSMLSVGGGVTEILFTSGNAQLGGTTFDAKIAQHLRQVLRTNAGVSTKTWSPQALNNIVLVGEAARIHLSNNRRVVLSLPTQENDWDSMEDPLSAIVESDGLSSNDEDDGKVMFMMNRSQMERICAHEFQELIRPLREVAIMAGAMLSGDASPSSVEAALAMEEIQESSSSSIQFRGFYDVEESPGDVVDNETILMQVDDIDVHAAKVAQQRGRKKARQLAKKERKYREEKRKLKRPANSGSGKVRDGISGRPISRIVLVGGATRMPTIGRLLTRLTGVVPQRTVNPDEAVALGCAVHAGILDSSDDGTGEMILNPMKAAILRAVAQQQGFGDMDDLEDEMEGFVEEEIII